jgi:hypothetical protein
LSLSTAPELVPIEWYSFYSVATRIVDQEGPKSRIQVHQNKYTLDRSLATIFAVGFWSSFWVWNRLGSPVVFIETGLFLLLLIVFELEHGYHWQLWGDSVIVETYALMWRSEK